MHKPWVAMLLFGLSACLSMPVAGLDKTIRSGAFVLRGMPFALGPYPNTLPAAPVDLHVSGGAPAAAAAAHAAVELDGDGRVVAVYACTLLDGPGKPGMRQVSFTPFPLPDGKNTWPAGSVRRFRLQRATEDQAASFAELTVERSEKELVVANPHYRIALAPVDRPPAGSAHALIRKITLPGGREFVPMRTVSDLTELVDGKRVIRMWRYDPNTPPRLERHGAGMATVTYAGGYDKVEATWRAAFTFYADLPLVRIRFQRQRRGSARFGFGRTMQLLFNPKASQWPVKPGQLTQERNDWSSLAVGAEPKGQIGFLLPDNRTSGLTYRADTWGYLCASWEAGGYRPFRTGDEDVREFYLFLSGEPESGESLAHRVAGLRALGEADWHVRINALFEQ